MNTKLQRPGQEAIIKLFNSNSSFPPKIPTECSVAIRFEKLIIIKIQSLWASDKIFILPLPVECRKYISTRAEIAMAQPDKRAEWSSGCCL